MRAVGYFAPGPVTAPNSLMDIELPRPSATGRDLLVEVRAVSANPVDYKVRASAAPPAGTAKVIGYDAAGVVVEAGPQASLFRPGDGGLLCGQHHPLGHQRRVSSRRRAHCRAPAALARICRGRGVAARIDHRVGSPVRPHGHPQAGGRVRPPRFSIVGRSSRRQLDRHPASSARSADLIRGGDRLTP